MRTSPLSQALLALNVGILVVASIGCSDTATIRYQYRLSFSEGFKKNGDKIKAGDDHFALYHIVCISTGDKAFTFTPSKLYTTEPGSTSDNLLNADYGIVSPVTVGAHQQKQNVGTVILRVKGSSGGNQPEPLFYMSSSNESVLLSNDGFPNSYGPTILAQGPAYPQGANLCKDDPIQSPH